MNSSMLDHWSDTLIRSYELVIGPTGIAFNLFVFGIMIKFTPETLKTYSIMIRLITISDLVMGLSVIMQTVRTFPTGNRMFAMLKGFCELYSTDLEARAKFCFFWHTQKMTSYLLNHVIFIVSYIYRVVLITMPFDSFDRTKVHSACYGYSIIHFAYFNWVYYMVLVPMDTVKEAISTVRPELITSNWTYYAVVDAYSPSQIVMTVASVLTPWIVLFISAICWWRIRRYLAKFQFSPSSKDLHKSLFNVLLAQTLGPLLTAATSAIYISVNARHDSVVPLLENLMQIPLGAMILFNPVVTVYFISPYRIAVLKFFHLYKPPVTPVLPPASSTLT